mmetsp:Transcript_32779/g.55670  ORF Transcript_32779/g.55670 Transcript_32779/m.55670 type:complete len:206 (+) Transcript_32779:741-1358(+)
MFFPLMSRWMRPFSWQYTSANRICAVTLYMYSSSSLPIFFTTQSIELEGTYSMMMLSFLPSLSTAYSSTMFGCDSFFRVLTSCSTSFAFSKSCFDLRRICLMAIDCPVRVSMPQITTPNAPRPSSLTFFHLILRLFMRVVVRLPAVLARFFRPPRLLLLLLLLSMLPAALAPVEDGTCCCCCSTLFALPALALFESPPSAATAGG